MGVIASNDKHEKLFQELLAVMRKYDLSQVDILAVCANMTGKVLALQDQTKGDAQFYMGIVAANLELGNKQAVEQIFGGADPSKFQ